MKIKIHNSLCSKNEQLLFILNSSIFLNLIGDSIYLKYRIDNFYYFVIFLFGEGEFKKSYGFGKDDKISDPNWYKCFKWKEMS